MKHPALGLLIILITSVAAFRLTSAFFSDTETSSGNTFTAGRLDLKVNGEDNPAGIINLADLKPGDDHLVNKTLFLDFNPAKIWLHIKDLDDDQGIATEPENQEENGTPKSDIQNYLTYDLKIGEETIIASSAGVLLSDAASCWIPLGQIPEAADVTLQQSFHFDAGVTNWAQGDILSFTEEFLAQQTNDPTIPDTGSGRVWSNQLNKCVSDLTLLHNLTLTCTSNCGGTYPHTLNIASMDTQTGNFSGNGFYNADSNYTWDVTGNTSGISFSAHILYTGLNPGYASDLTGTVSPDGTVSGIATSNTSQTFTFLLN